MNSIFLNTQNVNNGGSIYLENPDSVIYISGSSFINTISEKIGGSIFLDIKQSDISNCCFNNCSSKLSASSLFVRSEDNLIDNLLSESAITFCSCNSSTVQLLRGQQSLFSVNISNNQVHATSSAFQTDLGHKSTLTFLHSASNIGQANIELLFVRDVSSVQVSNFINNTNSNEFISISSGSWDFKKCIFAKNHGNRFNHSKDELKIADCIFDVEIQFTDSRILTNHITIRSDAPLNQLPTNFNGFCPASGTPTHPMPSPTPAPTKLETTTLPSQSVNEIPTQSEMIPTQTATAQEIIAENQLTSSFFALPAKILLVALVFFILFSFLIHSETQQNDNEVILDSVGQQIVGSIEMPDNFDIESIGE